MLGRLPWLALERRSRAFFFLVFFDIARRVYGRDRSVRQGGLDGATRAGSSGVTIGLKRVIEPSGGHQELLEVPADVAVGALGVGDLRSARRRSGAGSAPLTSIFSYIGNDTP